MTLGLDPFERLETLIRDRASGTGKFGPAGLPSIRRITESGLRPYLARKVLEEARALYRAVLEGDAVRVRTDTAELMEVLNRVLSHAGLTWGDVEETVRARARAEGGYAQGRLARPSPGDAGRLHAAPGRPLVHVLRHELARCRSAYLAVAFVMESGVRLVSNALAAALARGARIRLLTTDYLDVSEPDALDQLIALPGDLDVRIYGEPGRSFHPKAYLFEREDAGNGVAFVGSSNLSQSALVHGIEWNYELRAEDGGWPLHEFLGHFLALFESPHSRPATPESIAAYRQRRRPRSLADAEVLGVQSPTPVPRPAQVEALRQLEYLREDGEDRALVIAATGIGKTYLAAFDSRPFGRVLFLAHRGELLTQAERSFRAVRPFERTGFYDASHRDRDAPLLFASVQTLGKRAHLKGFAADHFDYLVVDEFHHAAADSYQNVLTHFRPRFLLGLTATPYRSDNRDIFALCGGNVAYRLSLFDAIGFGWLAPFHYYGVADATDYAAIPWRGGRYDESALSDALATRQRAAAVLAAFRQHPGRAALGFCVSIAHAEFMARYFSDHGVSALAVHSGADSVPRASALAALEQAAVEVLFTVDLFNEGVDIPFVDRALFLRPTDSMTVFLQQLGRGLRLHAGKAFLTVLDFIGNYRNAHYKLPLLAGLDVEPGTIGSKEFLRLLDGDAFKTGLPAGVQVHFDLEVIDLLRELARKPEPRNASLTAAFLELRGRLDHRPTLLDVHRLGRFAAKAYLQAFPGWYGFLRQAHLLEPEESRLEEAAGSFLREVEKTPMTKSYKMALLDTVLSLDGLERPVSASELAAGFRRFFEDRHHRRDLQGTEVEALEAVSDEGLRRYLERNPIAAWTNAGRSRRQVFFRYDGAQGELHYIGPAVPDKRLYNEAIRERLQYRLEAYFERRFERRNVFRVIGSGAADERGIVMLGEDPESPVPRGAGWKVVLIGETRMYAKFAKVAINVLKDGPVDGEFLPNRLTEVLEAWFGPKGYLPRFGNRVRISSAPDEDDVWVMEPVGAGEQGRSGSRGDA